MSAILREKGSKNEKLQIQRTDKNTQVPLQELELRPETLWERPQHDRALNTCVICPTDGRDVTGRWRNRPGSINARAVEPASAFVIQQPLLCVFLSIYVVSLIWCCLSFTSTQNKLHDGYKCNNSTWARADRITGCVFLPANKLSLLGMHTVCVLSAWEGSSQKLAFGMQAPPS